MKRDVSAVEESDDEESPVTDRSTAPSPLVAAVPVFAVVATFAAVAYTGLVTVVDAVTIQLLAYPTAPTAPFVVITGAILTIPVLAVTTIVTMRVTGG